MEKNGSRLTIFRVLVHIVQIIVDTALKLLALKSFNQLNDENQPIRLMWGVRKHPSPAFNFQNAFHLLLFQLLHRYVVDVHC